MCGLALIYGKVSSVSYQGCMESMLKSIKYRGPDSTSIVNLGNVVIGHNRLAIIDLTDQGIQPFCIQKYIIVFNGEIYNYIELRNELIDLGVVFETKTDTEVLLQSYIKWGEKCLDKLNGMFAFVVYDKESKEIFAARDRLGEKPLYYIQTKNELIFVSEIKQIVASNIVALEPNSDAIEQYLSFQFTINNQTLFKNVYKVEPGEYINFDGNKLLKRRYWSPDDFSIGSTHDYNDAKIGIKELVKNAISVRLRSDVNFGAYLSGGIDSSVIASIAATDLNNLQTFTFASKGAKNDESKVASLTAKHIKSNHTEVEIEKSDIASLWIKSIFHMDEPCVGYSLLPQMQISSKVSNSVKMILGGQGGDEIFCGYGWHSKFSSDKVNSSRLRGVLKKITGKKNKSYFDFWTSISCYQFVKNKDAVNKCEVNFPKNDLSRIRKFEIKYWLQSLLQVEDRASMASSIESRAPLLDHHLVEYALTLPTKFLLKKPLNKKIFIESFKSILLKSVYGAKKKKGYATPLSLWLKDERVKKLVNVIEEDNSFVKKYVNFKKINELTPRQIWMLVSLEIWHHHFFESNDIISKVNSNND